MSLEDSFEMRMACSDLEYIVTAALKGNVFNYTENYRVHHIEIDLKADYPVTLTIIKEEKNNE